MWFWIIASLTMIIVAAFFVLALLRGRETGQTPAQYDLDVYRDQLKSVVRDFERGVVSAEDSARIKTEISRRILTVDKAILAETDAQSAPRAVTIGVIALSIAGLLGSFGVYQAIGAPGYRDLPLQLRIEEARETKNNRPSQIEAEAQIPPRTISADPKHLELVKKLRQAVAKRPNDLKGNLLLAGNEAALGNYTAAYRAHKQVIALRGDKASAQDFSDLADLMVMAAGGFVSPETEAALQQALQRDPEQGTALYYTGLMFAQSGRPDIAFRIWRDLLDKSSAGDPWVRPIRGQIQDAAAWAGENYSLPPLKSSAPVSGPIPGPSAEDMEAAGEMSEQDREEMIQNMVAQLSDRLANEGGSAQEWARLISALGVLGDAQRAANIWTEAQTVFAGHEKELEIVLGAARSAGVAE